jgi:hypothetical protein
MTWEAMVSDERRRVPVRWRVEESAVLAGHWVVYAGQEFHVLPTWREAYDYAYARARLRGLEQ